MMVSAMSNSDRLAELINSILDFSKIEAGQMEVFPKPINAERIAHEAVESMRPWAQKRDIPIRLEVQSGLPMVTADLSRSLQVMVNIISNAIKFSPKGRDITIKVSTGGESARHFVVYCVQDSGPGIPKDQQARVFEKFVQIAAGERHVGGTGLGLAIAKAFVHMQKGQMWLESEAGKGARFYFSLPIYVPPREEAVVKKAPPKKLPWWKKLFGIKP